MDRLEIVAQFGFSGCSSGASFDRERLPMRFGRCALDTLSNRNVVPTPGIGPSPHVRELFIPQGACILA